MNKLKFVVSLTNDENDYQVEQAAAAEDAAKRLGIDLEIIHADNDSIKQSQQLLQRIQSRSTSNPDAILFEPAGGTALPQVARAAAAAGIGWAVLNREVEYLSDLRKAFRVLCDFRSPGNRPYSGTPDWPAVASGRYRPLYTGAGREFGGERTNRRDVRSKAGCRASEAHAGPMDGSQRPEGGPFLLRLSTSQSSSVDMVVAQDDSMAMGARKAFQEVADPATRERWLRMPLLGCDGLPDSGQSWVRKGLLTATIYVPPNAGQAIEMMAKALQTGTIPAEKTLTTAVSFPGLEKLAPIHTGSKAFSAFSR